MLMVPFAEFELGPKAETVPSGARGQAVCNVIYQNVYVVRPIDVSGLWSNYIPVIYQSAS